VNRQDRVLIRHRPTGVDHFLRTPLHLRIAALDGIEIEIRGIGTGRHRRRGAATHADPHAGAAKLNQQATGRQVIFLRMLVRDAADAAGDHDRLVITVHRAADVLFIGTEKAAQDRTAEFIVECRAADWTLDHDLQCGRNAIGLAVGCIVGFMRSGLRDVAGIFPSVPGLRQHQVGDGEPGQAGFRFGPPAGRAFIADFAAGAGRCAGKRRNRGRMIMRLRICVNSSDA